MVFDKNLESQVLGKLCNLFPSYKNEIDKVRAKMVDLAEPIQNFNFYHPKFNGNFSLKAVAGIFNEESDYAALEIASGIVAMHKYEGLLTEENEIIAEQTKQQLKEYCNLDTLTCQRFFDYLQEKIKE